MAAGATAIGGLVHGGASFAGLARRTSASAGIIVVLQVTMAAAFGALAAQTRGRPRRLPRRPDGVGDRRPTRCSGRRRRGSTSSPPTTSSSSSHPFDHLAQTLTAVTVWVVVPSTIGITRSLRREVK